jgi:aminoglycoside 3-N-acetyltransferase
MLKSLISTIPKIERIRLRSVYFNQKKKIIDTFFSYGTAELVTTLHAIGIQHGDTVLVHSSFGPFSGFRGSPEEVVDAFLRSVGPSGNLLMVSMPYLDSSYEYLQTLKCFDIRNTISRMGLISESFRRRGGVLRSLHPTHPVLAFGPKAEWIVSGHENCPYPCGPGSPFEKLLKLNGKVLFYGASAYTFTFYHYLEHLVKDELPFPVYEDQPFKVHVIDHQGQARDVTTYVYSRESIPRRRPGILFAELMRRKQWKKARLGNTRIVLIDVSHAFSSTLDLAKRGIYFYEMSRSSGA